MDRGPALLGFIVTNVGGEVMVVRTECLALDLSLGDGGVREPLLRLLYILYSLQGIIVHVIVRLAFKVSSQYGGLLEGKRADLLGGLLECPLAEGGVGLLQPGVECLVKLDFVLN